MTSPRSSSHAAPLDARIFAIVNQKGGVGKTTTAVNLATALAACGLRVLVVDADSQGNAATGFGLSPDQRDGGVYDLVTGNGSVASLAMATEVPGLKVIPGSANLTGLDAMLATEPGRERRLRAALEPARREYDYILIDCPPALGLMTLNALCAADAVLAPLQCEYYSLEGVSRLMEALEIVRRGVNPTLELHGVVLTMYDRRNNLSAMVEEDVRRYFGERAYQTVIPRNVRVSEAPSHGKPVLLYDFNSSGAKAYVQLAAELLRRERDRTAP